MLQISKEYAKNNNLKQIGIIRDTDITKTF